MTAKKMSEKQMSKAVIDLAHLHGWKVAHFHTAQGKEGRYITPVAGDGKGFPDLVLVRPPKILFAELKVAYNRTTEEQDAWLDLLGECVPAEYINVQVHIWRDKDYDSGVIESCLK